MHELALAEALLAQIEQVASEHRAVRVPSALLEIGAMTHAEPESLRFAFEALSRDSVAAGCVLEIREVPVQVACGSCGYRGATDPERPGCPSCDGLGLEIIAGRELRLVHVDIDHA